MPPVIVPPTGNGAAQTLMLLFLRTEQKLLQEIKRKRESNFVDYAEVAALFRVRKDLSRMMQGAEKYAPMAIEHEFFYEGGKHRAGYKNAMSAVNPGRTLAIEQLVDNLLGEVREAAETAYQTTQNALYLLGRVEPDIFRTEGIKKAVEALTEGVGPMTKTNALVKAIEGEGITAFTDKAGRDWDLHSYGNMAVRTTVRQAQVSAVLTEDDHDLYQISKIGTTCPVCAIYEGRVYSKSGTNPNYPPLSAAFGKIDPAGADDLSNTFLNIHPNCLHSVRKFTEASKTPEQLRKIREFSSFTTNPATNDPRSKKQIAAYREKERNRAKLREDVKQWRKYMAAGVEGVPKDFATFRKWKEAQNDKYHELMSAYRKRDKK